MNWKYQLIVWAVLIAIFVADVYIIVKLPFNLKSLLLPVALVIQFIALFLIAMAAMYN